MLHVTLLSLVAISAESAQLERLVSPDPAERYRAVVDLSDSPLGSDAVPFIRRYIEREVVDMESPFPERYATRPLKYEPLAGDTALVRLKANPKMYEDQFFTVVGQAKISSYYNFAYDKAQESHFSIELDPITPNGQREASWIHVYVAKTFGAILADRLAAAEERKAAPIFVRFKVLLFSSSQHDMLEGLDWQFYDTESKSWTPWALESLGQGIGLLARTGKPTALVEVITQPTPHGTVSADGFVRYAATLHIAKMDKPHRNRAIREIKKAFTAARKAKNNELAAILNRAAAIILREGK